MPRTTAMPLLEVSYGNRLKTEPLQEILGQLFYEILPRHGYALREKQVELAREILDAIAGREILLAEAAVGIGKTHAYILAATLAKCGRLNDFWLSGLYPQMPYRELAYLPVVISTSSIALQKAIVQDYIPSLSDILLEHHLIETPLTAIVRKGREHYLCEARLWSHLASEKNEELRCLLQELLFSPDFVDLAEEERITLYLKRKIGVAGRCDAHCGLYHSCRYRRFMEQASSPKIDFQICNHNYFLADILCRSTKQRPLIPNYQTIIVDEAHKFLQAARQMMGTSLSSFTFPEALSALQAVDFKSDQRDIQKLAEKLTGQNRRLFRQLLAAISKSDMSGEAERLPAVLDKAAVRHLKNIRDISEELLERIVEITEPENGEGKKARLVWQLAQISRQAGVYTNPSELVTWLEIPSAKEIDKPEILLNTIPKNLNQRLYTDVWSRGIPMVLTSGTLSVAGDFAHTRGLLGLDRVNKLKEITEISPFNYPKQALLYISEKVPFPDSKNEEYIEAVAQEVEELLRASHGHGAVLFTSYRVMDAVWNRIHKRVPFPVFQMNKDGIKTLEHFKASGNGVLFASGALWEGIDLPGDILSMLILVKLPFPAPDPLSEYERSLYPSLAGYKQAVIVPEMLMKLKQGFGRLIRAETDTGVVAILDSRAGACGAYRSRVLRALPPCRVTADITNIRRFFQIHKPAEYFR